MSEINQERLALGTAALRSGNYPQAVGCLRQATGYCCLGVFTEVAIANGLKLSAVEGLGEGGMWIYDRNESGVMPRKVADWYGFEHCNPKLRLGEVHTTAVGANDSLGNDFNWIADAFDNTYGVKEDGDDA